LKRLNFILAILGLMSCNIEGIGNYQFLSIYLVCLSLKVCNKKDKNKVIIKFK